MKRLTSYLIVLVIAIVMGFLSFGLFAMFGFTNFGFWRKAAFLAVLTLQSLIPLAALYFIYEIKVKAEADFEDQYKAEKTASRDRLEKLHDEVTGALQKNP